MGLPETSEHLFDDGAQRRVALGGLRARPQLASDLVPVHAAKDRVEMRVAHEAPGGIEHNARLTAAYWDALWKKLNNEPAPLVIATFPENNTQILSVDYATVDSHISVFFSSRYEQATVTGDTFLVRDAAGAQVAGAFAWCYGSNMVRFMPDADLAPHSRYTVTLTTGLRDAAGAPLPQDFVFEFTTP